MKLSVIVPVYNEEKTILEIIHRIQRVAVDKEIILVEDGSTDGTREVIEREIDGQPDVRVILQERNMGKGKAIRTGIAAAQGDAVIIQDADLEYDPRDYVRLLEALEREKVNVVYGSRFLSGRKVTQPWHRFVNYTLTVLTNILYGCKLTDMETCYKLFRRGTVQSLDLRSDGFEIEPEITARILQRRERIVEVPISYKGRSFHEGKKIGWKDGFIAIFTLLRHRFSR